MAAPHRTRFALVPLSTLVLLAALVAAPAVADVSQVKTLPVSEVFERLDKLNREDNVAALAALKKNGMEVFTLPADEQQRWQAVADKATEEMIREDAFSVELLQKVTQYRDAYRSQASAVD